MGFASSHRHGRQQKEKYGLPLATARLICAEYGTEQDGRDTLIGPLRDRSGYVACCHVGKRAWYPLGGLTVKKP